MNRSLHVLLAAALATGGAAAVLATSAAPVGAAGRSCTAWATLPARVALTSAGTTVRPQLVGTAGCRADSFDGGATADLRASGQRPYEQRWAKFGAHEQITFRPTLNGVGRYTIDHGDVNVYDANEVRVPASWRTTSTVVRFGARFGSVASSGGGATATLKHYSADGWRASAHTTVALQKHTSGGWTTVARARTGTHGKVGFARALHGQYRLLSANSSRVWETTVGLGNRA